MTQTQTDPVLVERRGDVAVLTLNRPRTLNATDRELHRAVAGVWSEVAADDGVGAVVLTGAGRAFSAGGNASLLQAMVEDTDLRREVLEEGAALVRAMLACPVPIVSAVNGPAVGLGWSLASASDLVVMADTAFFADPHVMIGLVAADGGALTLPLLSGLLRAKEFVLLGDRVPASEALRLGLANRVVPGDDVLPTALELAQRLADYPRQAVRETRQVLNLGLQRSVDAVLDHALAAESASFDEPAFREKLAGMLAR